MFFFFAIRYVNIDYLFFTSLKGKDFVDLVVSYDIACQWSVKIWERMKKYDVSMHIDNDGHHVYVFLVPKFHLPAHVGSCQTLFSFNFTENVGRTDGEAPERGWSIYNPVSTSTREMGPGFRRDTLDDLFGYVVWKKTCQMGTLLRCYYYERY